MKTFGNLYSTNNLVINASASGIYNNTTYVVDNVRGGSTNGPYGDYTTDGNIVWVTTNGLAQSGVPASVILYRDGLETNGLLPHLTNAANVAGYICWGDHSSLGPLYATTNAMITNGSIPVIWTGQSSWYLIRTEESFNGMRYQTSQGDFVQWFASTAFGGTSYANTPVAALSYTDEPQGGDNANDVLFQPWSGGNNFAICAWASRNTSYYQVVGDPFVKH